MSTPIRLISLGLLLAALAIGAWFAWEQEETSSTVAVHNQKHMLPKAARGTPENPDARREYALRRLRNPKTGELPNNLYKKERAFAKQMPARLAKSGAPSWQLRGPTNVGGRSRALEIDVRSPNADTILAGGVSGGMWRTTDGGQNWTRTFEPAQRPNVTAVAQDKRPGREDVWFAGTGEAIGSSPSGGGAYYGGNGIYKSTDGGQSWSLLDETMSDATSFDSFFDFSYAIEVDSTASKSGTAGTDSEVYAATYARIYRSTDGGSNWTVVLPSDTTNNGTGNFAPQTDVAITSDGEVYAALSSRSGQPNESDRRGLFYSPTGDKGSWTDITPDGWPTSSFGRTVLAVNPSNEDEVWAIAEANGSGPNGHELWKYDRATKTWTDSTEYLPDRGGFPGTFNSQGGYDLLVDVHPENGDIIFIGGVNLWRLDVSTSATDPAAWIGGYGLDGGGLYSPAGSDPQHPDQHAIAFKPNDGDVMFSGSDGGIHRTDDNRAGGAGSAGDGAVLWTSLNNGYFTTQFYAVCQFLNPDNDRERARIAGGLQDNGTWSTASTDPADPWTEQLGADGGYCALTNEATSEGSSRYVSTQNGGVFRLAFFANGDRLLTERVDPPNAGNQLFINPFAIDPSDPDVMYYPAGGTLWRNDDIENSPSAGWEEMTGATVSGQAISALDVSIENDENVLYYGTNGGTVKRLDDANTTGTGTSPTDVTGDNFPEDEQGNSIGYVSSIAVSPDDSDKVMVVFSNYGVTSLFYSTDGGSSWTAVEGNLGDDKGFSPSVRSAAISSRAGTDPAGTTFYVGTSIGVYATTTLDGSNTQWTQEGASEIGDVVVDQVQVRPYDGRVIVATHGNGTYDFNPPNAAPVAEGDTYNAVEEGTLTINAPGVLENDTDADQLTASVVNGPSNGNLTLESDGSFEYTPNDGFSGTDQFTYQAADPFGLTDETTVELPVGPNTIPAAPSQLTAQKQDGNLQLDWSPVEETDLDRYRIYRDTAPIGQDVTSRTPYDSVSASTTSFVDGDAASGTTYYYRITAVDNADQEGSPSQQDYVFFRPASVSISATRSFGEAAGPGDYRLVALPGEANRSLAQTLAGDAGTEWQAYWDDGSPSFMRYDDSNSNTFTFQKGRGFWVTSRQDWSVTISDLPTVTLRGDTAATIPLNDGWTIISNPLEKDVSWATVDAANSGTLQPLWPFDGAFNESAQTFSSAKSGRAYYFFNDDSARDSLVVPHPSAPGKSTRPPSEKTAEAPSLLALSARPQGVEKPASTVQVGLGEKRTVLAPPGRFEAVSLRIDADEEEGPSSLMAARRRAEDGGYTFDLTVNRRVEGLIQIQATELSAVEGREVALLHPAAGQSYDLRGESSIVINLEDETTDLKVAVGTDAYVDDEESAVIPDEVMLTTYPNPVQKRGTVEYTLPEKSAVTLRVYDVLGREVATLASGRKEAGRHTVRLGTERLSSGVYFSRLSVGNQTVTQKITVVR